MAIENVKQLKTVNGITQAQGLLDQGWAVAGSECNTVIELKREHHAASPRLLASLRPSPRSGI